MRILVLQLARLGDVLQTLPAIQGLKRKHPDAQIDLLVRSTFADSARLSPHVDNLIEFPSRTIFDSETKSECLAKLIHWLSGSGILKPENSYDLLLNLTFSDSSAYLSSMIPAKEKRGFTRQRDGSYFISDPWSQYFFSQVLSGSRLNILHLNDLFARVAGVPCESIKNELRKPVINVAKKKTAAKRIGIQLAASQSSKTLTLDAWKTVCLSIAKGIEGSELVFFGSEADKASINEAIASLTENAIDTSRITNLAGSLRFHENIAWVESCDFIVSPDTALVHLASHAGTKVLQLSLGSVRCDETGPYGNGHHILQPLSSDAQKLGDAVVQVLNGEKSSAAAAHSSTALVKCSDGTFRNEVQPVNYVPEENSHFFAKAYYLLAEFRCSGKQEDVEIPKLGDPRQPAALNQMLHNYDALCTMRRTTEFGQHYCLKILENIDDKTQLRALFEQLTQIETLLESLHNAVPLVRPLIDTWKVAKGASIKPGAAAFEVISISEGAYRELGQNIEIMQQLLQTAVDAAQKRLGASVPAESLPKERDLS